MQTLEERFRRALLEEAGRLGIALPGDQLDALAEHYRLLVKWNARIRLVGSTEPARAASELFADSLVLMRFIESLGEDYRRSSAGIGMIDIGSGAGLPGIVVKLLRPGWALTVVESQTKKVAFLKRLLARLGLEAVVLRGRAEALARNNEFRESFDLAFCRAVARPAAACELAIPFVKVGGSFIAQLGGRAERLRELGKAADALNATLGKTVSYNLTGVSGSRTLARVRKAGPTPSRYPRTAGEIKRRPLA